MITITINGLDQFVVGDLSRDLTPSLAKLYEVEEDDINFVAPASMVFHKGVEQTSWNIYIEVSAPLKVQVLEEEVARFLIESIGDIAIHKTVIFRYYSQDNRYQVLNDDYPRYIDQDNEIKYDLDDQEEYEEGEESDQVYTGDVFENFNKN